MAFSSEVTVFWWGLRVREWPGSAQGRRTAIGVRTLDLGVQMIALANGKSTRRSALAAPESRRHASSLTLHPKPISFARWTSCAAASSPEPRSPEAHRAGEQLMASVSLTEVTKSFGAVEVLHP